MSAELRLTLIDNEGFRMHANPSTFLLDFLNTQYESIQHALIRDLTFISQLAHYKSGLKIERVVPIEPGVFQLYFHYQWHIFQGCLDLDEMGEINDKVTFIVTEQGQVVFDLSLFEGASTADEL
ncbi:MAG: hypothetical protein GXO35_05665 [Gammaproteobacteria bacterium]|nr:hypothetical protein [Gammaproteobacteria bacterium]